MAVLLSFAAMQPLQPGALLAQQLPEPPELPALPGLTGLPESPVGVPTRVSVASMVEDRYGPSQPDAPPDDLAMAALLPSLGYPLAQPALQIDPWGWRYSTARAAWRMHTGVDLAAAAGTPVLAALSGRVLLVDYLGGYGLTVILDHGKGIQTLYAHLQDCAVSIGQRIEPGATLGRVGMSGAASGPHLHFELRSRVSSAVTLAHDPTPLLPPLLAPPALDIARTAR